MKNLPIELSFDFSMIEKGKICLILDCHRMEPKLANLANWQIGLTKAFEPQDEVVQWILDAVWYNWPWEDRVDITRGVEASRLVWITPMRLGVRMAFPVTVNGEKRHANIFICLYDRRIMKLECFQMQTYKEWFAGFLRNIEYYGKHLFEIKN